MTEVAEPAETTEQREASAPEQRPALVIPLVTLAWVSATLLFWLLRLGIIWHAPVGGAELAGLSGAWTARVGAPDGRFVPTLFQAITTLFLHWTTSELPARVLAYLATATIPGAVYLLRRQLTEAGALVTLVLLSLGALAISLGSSASAMGFDLAITVWLFVAIVRGHLPPWGWGLLAFGIVTAGPVALPLLAGWAGVRLVQRRYPPLSNLAWAIVGLAAGVVLTTFRFGLGVDGFRIAPFELFTASFSQAWSTATAFQLFLVYSIPVVVAGIAAAVTAVRRLTARDREPGEEADLVLCVLAWAGVAFAWAVAGASSHSPIALIALSTALAFLVGPWLVEAITTMVRADWRQAKYVVPIVLFLLLFFGTVAASWARTESVPGGAGALFVVALVVAGVAAWLWLRNAPSVLPALFAIPLAVAAFPFLSMGLNTAFSGVGDPMPSPVSPGQMRQLRDILLAHLKETGGTLVVNPALANDLTWPFRDSGTIVVASHVPANAGAVIWPLNAPHPAGLTQLQGQWNVLREIQPPTGDLLEYYHWFTNRGIIGVQEQQVAVYVKAAS